MAARKKSNQERPVSERKDYWDKIAEDVSSGYGAEQVKKSARQEELLNEDQEPDDEKRGDVAG